MAYEIPGKMITLPAGADLSSSQYLFVTADTSGNAVLPGSTEGVSILGVLQNKPTSGQAASVMIDGVSKVRAISSTVAAGDIIAASSAGYAVATVTGDNAVGHILAGTSGGLDRVLTVHITPIGTT